MNSAYASAVGRTPDELVGMAMFDAFPDNPDDPAADGVANLGRSLDNAARQRRAHRMLVQRYDIADGANGGWLPRVWSPVNSPVLDDRSVMGLLHQVHDITILEDDLCTVLRGYRDILLQSSPDDRDARQLAQHADAIANYVISSQATATEIMHLRRALTSRATIDQAKGIVMAESHCSPEEAFDVLRKLSADSNVRLADVALALVYKAQGPAQGSEA